VPVWRAQRAPQMVHPSELYAVYHTHVDLANCVFFCLITNNFYESTVCHVSHTHIFSESYLMDPPSHTVGFIGDGFVGVPFAISASHTIFSIGL
jgi:hypothetical protein